MPVHLSKLTSTLRQLSETELVKLQAYLSSPYFETTPGALTLLQYLSKFHPHYDEKKIAPGVIQKKVPALGNQKKQANAGTDLLKYVENFLAVEDFLANADSVNRHKLQAYKNHHLFDMFNKEHAELLAELDKNTWQDFDVFYQRHMLTELALSGFDAKLNRTIHNEILPVTKTLDVFYALKKLYYHCELRSRHQILGTPYSEDNISYIFQTLEPFKNEKYPFVFLFGNIYQLLSAKTFTEGEDYYQRLKKFIEENTTSPLPVSIKESINNINNYCLYWNNLGYEKAGAQALWWYQLKIKHDLLKEQGMIQPSEFRNIVSLALTHLKKPDWIKQFIETHVAYLPNEHFETNSAFVWAQYYYCSKEYDKAMPLFQQAQVKEEPIFNAIVRRWQFMCLYEQNPTDIDLLSDFLDAYDKYIQRYAASLHWLKDIFSKNIFYARKMLKATDVQKRKALTELLNSEIYFTGKEWLLKQL